MDHDVQNVLYTGLQYNPLMAVTFHKRENTKRAYIQMYVPIPVGDGFLKNMTMLAWNFFSLSWMVELAEVSVPDVTK